MNYLWSSLTVGLWAFPWLRWRSERHNNSWTQRPSVSPSLLSNETLDQSPQTSETEPTSSSPPDWERDGDVRQGQKETTGIEVRINVITSPLSLSSAELYSAAGSDARPPSLHRSYWPTAAAEKPHTGQRSRLTDRQTDIDRKMIDRKTDR